MRGGRHGWSAPHKCCNTWTQKYWPPAAEGPSQKSCSGRTPSSHKGRRQTALDDATRNTRFQYVIVDELDYFVVRIIDSNTDKVIKEIPSKELQRAHQGIAEAIGILFDEEI